MTLPALFAVGLLAAAVSAGTRPVPPNATTNGARDVPVSRFGPGAGVRSAAFGAPVKLGPCTLYPSEIHLRKSQPGYIGPKPYTRCEVPVTSIRQVTELDYEWYAWWKQVLEKAGGNTGERNFRQKRIAFKCRGFDSTVWAGSTAGTIVYQGHTYYTRVWQKQVRLPCGR